MRKSSAYQALARELERWASMPAKDLVESMGKPAIVQSEHIDGEDIAIEITIQRHDKNSARITAVANGPSHWRLERLEESIVIRLPGE